MPSSLRAGAWAHRGTLDALGQAHAFTPKDTAPDLWVDAEGVLGVSDGAQVGATVPDLSGHNVVVQQQTQASRPLWFASVGGGPALGFDGVNHYLSATLALTPPFTVLAVAQNTQATDDGLEHSIWDAVGGNEYCLRGMGTTNKVFDLIGPVGLGDVPTTIPFTDTTWRTWLSEVGSSQQGLRTLAKLKAAQAYSWTVTAAGPMHIGGRALARLWKGYMKAILVWNRLLTPTEKLKLERYYAGKLGQVLVPHVPTDVPGLRLWLCGDDLGGADQALVSTWPDRSALAMHHTQSDPARQFRLVAPGVMGHRSVRFAEGCYMTGPVVANYPQPFTYFGILSQNEPAGTPGVHQVLIASLPDAVLYMDGGWNRYAIWGGSSLVAPMGPSLDVPVALVGTFTTPTGAIYVNGQQVVSGALGAAQAGTMRVGAQSSPAHYGKMDVCDVGYVGNADLLTRLVLDDYLLRRLNL